LESAEDCVLLSSVSIAIIAKTDRPAGMPQRPRVDETARIVKDKNGISAAQQEALWGNKAAGHPRRMEDFSEIQNDMDCDRQKVLQL
jgi:hypothetical protein